MRHWDLLLAIGKLTVNMHYLLGLETVLYLLLWVSPDSV